jgi:hypothetical protein
MKILILHLFLGSILLMGAIQPPGRDQLSKRLMALRFRHTFRNRKAHQ